MDNQYLNQFDKPLWGTNLLSESMRDEIREVVQDATMREIYNYGRERLGVYWPIRREVVLAYEAHDLSGFIFLGGLLAMDAIAAGQESGWLEKLHAALSSEREHTVFRSFGKVVSEMPFETLAVSGASSLARLYVSRGGSFMQPSMTVYSELRGSFKSHVMSSPGSMGVIVGVGEEFNNLVFGVRRYAVEFASLIGGRSQDDLYRVFDDGLNMLADRYTGWIKEATHNAVARDAVDGFLEFSKALPQELSAPDWLAGIGTLVIQMGCSDDLTDGRVIEGVSAIERDVHELAERILKEAKNERTV